VYPTARAIAFNCNWGKQGWLIQPLSFHCEGKLRVQYFHVFLCRQGVENTAMFFWYKQLPLPIASTYESSTGQLLGQKCETEISGGCWRQNCCLLCWCEHHKRGKSSQGFCTGYCPALGSCADAIGRQKLKWVKLLVIKLNYCTVFHFSSSHF